MRGTWRQLALPSGTVGWAERPVVRGGVIAMGLSSDAPAAGANPVVAVHDLDGSPGFVITHDALGARELETSQPTIDEAGIVRAVVYEHDVELRVVAAYADGTLLPGTSLGSEYPLRASDSTAPP